MRYSTISSLIERRIFDPSKRKDQMELKFYMQNGRWKDRCPFYAEYPWVDVPAMCKDKYSLHQLQKLN